MRPRQLQETLERVFGHRSLRSGQAQVIELLAARESVLAQLRTGGGKSLCYQLPALLLEGATVVVSPLLALMRDQTDACLAAGIPAARIDSTMSRDEIARTVAGVRQGRIKLLYVSPERLASAGFARSMAGVRVSLAVIDEAHTISAWGAGFRPELLRLPRLVRALGAERVLALTATATPEVARDICESFGIERRVTSSVYRPNLELDLQSVRARDRTDALLGLRWRGPAIVYATYRRTCEQLADELSRAGRRAEVYHAGQGTAERRRVQEWFMAARDGIVCSTIAFGMGIDKPDIRHVVHYNMPRSLEGYAQEIGRAGRDGLPATCTLFASADDIASLRNAACRATPVRGALGHAVEALFGRADRYLLDTGLLAAATGLDEPVLETALWWLERGGHLCDERRFSTVYRIFLRRRPGDLAAAVPDRERHMVREILGRTAPDGRVDVSGAARRLGCTREAVADLLSALAVRGLLVLDRQVARRRITIRHRNTDSRKLADGLERFFGDLERLDLERIDAMLAMLESPRCQTASLVEHFGERLPAPCGHCTFCRTGRPVYPKAGAKPPRLPPRDQFEGFRAAFPGPLGDARGAARFLAGFGSRELAAWGLEDHPGFGLLARYDFDSLRRWLAEPSQAAAGPGGFEAYAAAARAAADRRRDRSASLVASRAVRRRRAVPHRP